MVAVGASFGAIAIAYGLPGRRAVLMSLVVFAGGAQFLAVGLIAAGNPVAAIFAGLLLNARHLPFGLAVARDRRRPLAGPADRQPPDDRRGRSRSRWREPDPARRRRAYWLIGFTLFVLWNLGTALGVLLGGAAGDPDALGPGRGVPGRADRADAAVAADRPPGWSR